LYSSEPRRARWRHLSSASTTHNNSSNENKSLRNSSSDNGRTKTINQECARSESANDSCLGLQPEVSRIKPSELSNWYGGRSRRHSSSIEVMNFPRDTSQREELLMDCPRHNPVRRRTISQPTYAQNKIISEKQNGTAIPDKPEPTNIAEPSAHFRQQIRRRHTCDSDVLRMGTHTKEKLLSQYHARTRLKSRSGPKSAERLPSREKRVKFADKKTMHWYLRPPADKDKQFYNQFDVEALSDAMICHARKVRSCIKEFTITMKDESFNSLTGLPSPEMLQQHLACPEDIIGIEHLLCGNGITQASLKLKSNHLKLLISGQQMGLEANEISRKLRKYSNINVKMAICRASYAAMF